MEVLSKEIELLREWGISQGLTDLEMDKCLLRALDGTIPSPAMGRSKEGSNRLKCQWLSLLCRCLKIIAKAFGCFVFLFICLYVTISLHEPTGQIVGRFLEPIAHPLHRVIRLTSLPAARMVDLTGIHYMDCLVVNPLFAPPPIDCQPYHEDCRLQTKTSKDAHEFQDNHLGSSIVLFKDTFSGSVSFHDLQTLYTDNKMTFQSGSSLALSEGTNVTSLHDLMTNFTEKTLQKNPEFYSEWFCYSVDPSRAFRSLFAKPSFVSAQNEVALEKYIIIESSQTGSRELPRSRLPNMFYIQASGTRHLALQPNPACRRVCRDVDVVMTPGDILYASEHYWSIVSSAVLDQPGASHSELSVAMVGSFT